MIPKIDFALDQQPREPLPAPVFTALCPGSPCAVCGAIEDAGGITATPRTRGLCTAHFKAETQITLKAETGANAHLCAAYVATLPTGERVELPAGTMLREGTGAIDHSHLLACARGVVDFATHEPIDGPLMRALLSALRAACGDSIEDVALRAGPPEPMSPAWINAQFREVTQAEGEAILADLTERVGLPREMAPSEWPTPRAMAEAACHKRSLGQGFQSGFEEGVIAERARFEAAPLVSLADYAKPRT